MTQEQDIETTSQVNHLFPVFLKLEEFRLLIVGGGKVAFEKLNAVLSNSPRTKIKLVACAIHGDIQKLAMLYPNLKIHQRSFQSQDLTDSDVVITAVNDRVLSEDIFHQAKAAGKLVNSADLPTLCDFYLGSIVRKGNLKIAISTNGKSPTVAKRLKEILTDAMPIEIDHVINNMSVIREKLNGNFHERVKRLHELTQVISVEELNSGRSNERHVRRIVTYFLFAFFFMFLGHLVLSYVPYENVMATLLSSVVSLKAEFYLMVVAGFVAQLVDGALGMGYGVTSTTILLSAGINLPAISGSVHTAEMFSSGISGYSHYRFGNVNKKLFRTLLIPGVLGAIAGAYLLSRLGNEYANIVRPILATYTLFLGIKIIRNAFRRNTEQAKVKHVGWLAGAGGFLDSFGGGGWGPLVTSTLISKGKSPRYVIGSVSLAEFFVTLASALTFFALLGVSHWPVILGLIIGGAVAAPIAAKLVGKLPMKTMFLCVAALVIFWSIRIILKSIL
ncbi:MAG TPA: TSUP family transporter [Cyclobacteriaceae bacterium]|jgi:siroheme synthase-like protein|nr:TSUP family transporter [Cyclobacteriaceae bacterium]